MLAVLYTDGELKVKDIVHECTSQKWVPLLLYKEKNSEKKKLVCFEVITILHKFVQRNVPKTWTIGAVSLSKKDLEWAKTQGWEIEILNFPRKLAGNPNVEVFLEVLEFQGSEPDIGYYS